MLTKVGLLAAAGVMTGGFVAVVLAGALTIIRGIA